VSSIYKAPSRTTPKTTTFSSIDEIDTSDLEQEDPKVIKELIELIKKAGGIEELEKQINTQEQSDAIIKSDSKATTPGPIINKSLVDKIKNRASLFKSRPPLFNGASQPEKVIEQKTSTSTQSTLQTSGTDTSKKYNSINRFSRPQSQSAGVEKVPESDAILIEKPQYTSIRRVKPAKPEVIAENDYNNDSDRNTSKEDSSKSEINKKYASINRSRKPAIANIEVDKSDEIEDEDNDDNVYATTTTSTSRAPSKYINLNRRRITTTEKLVYSKNNLKLILL
jgi:chitinase